MYLKSFYFTTNTVTDKYSLSDAAGLLFLSVIEKMRSMTSLMKCKSDKRFMNLKNVKMN